MILISPVHLDLENDLIQSLYFFFKNAKKKSFKKIQVWDLIGALIPHLYFFLNENFFEFPKKLQVLDQVHFKKQLDQPTLVIFFAF